MGRRGLNALAVGRRDTSRTAALLLRSLTPAWPFAGVSLLQGVAWSRGEGFAPGQEHESLQQISLPLDLGETETLGVKRNNHYFSFFIW